MIQFMTVVMLYQQGSNLSDFEFLWEDLAIAMPLAFCMGATPPSDTLSKLLPEDSLLGLPTIVSVVGSTAIQLGVQLGLFFPLNGNPWNERAPVDPEDRTANWPSDANTVLFQISNFQLIMTSIAFSVSYPFRKPMYHNLPFCFFVLSLAFFAFFWIVLNEVEWVGETFYTMIIPQSFRYWTLMIVLGNSLLTYFFEKLFVYAIQVCNYARLQNKRLRRIEEQVFIAKNILKQRLPAKGKVDPNETQNLTDPRIKQIGVVNRED